MASELAAAFQRLIRQVSAALESAASGVSQRLRAVSEAGLREPARALPAADTVVAKPIKFPPPPELRAPTSRERWHALADIAEGRLPEPKIFNSPDLDALARSKLHIALENQWPGTKSIKERAARVVTSKLNDLPPGVPVRIASSGNHAIAYAGALGRRRIPVIAVVPENTSAMKISKLEERGATVIRYGSSYDDAYSHAKRLTEEQGGRFLDVSAHDSVAALGTAVHDMLSLRPSASTLVLPAGGGTVASAAQVVRDFEEVWGGRRTVLVACPENAPTVYESFKAGEPVTVPAHTMAEAVNVGTVDAHLLPQILDAADDVVLVPESSIREGVPLLSAAIGSPVEAGATLGPMAVIGSQGVLHGASGAVHDVRGQEVLTLVTGGNVAPAQGV
ncbi:pyridoxal-phosphate dependent enzyme [Nocardia otitidiscaviarum]|uniref:pyridoxal-phosphate dependent enzyme n=1 Tax=Nocardia otitidiscaviarum TaxID=1823 RepID=UPI00163D5558|nr:pyridoxal-phosphate dependent enzyme [Nocardia otitidiscaviarum]MBF6180411.1 pyridoxal-phosphate dependent enzyme [Nocardia otitidiscaviarum]MCP9618565.1 pyridoxal-phosphate dependent enzyme [Nocardia otitidiscaviarum]